jgi:RNA polymerase sigma factor (sigma-70 family)
VSARANPEGESDSHLIELARAGDERAFEAIYERYRAQLLAHCRRIVSEAAAQDAVQQAFVSAWCALQRGHEVRELRAWLFMIARRAALEPLRAQTPADELTEEHAGGRSPHELTEQSAHARAALAAVAELPPRERDALVWTSLHGSSGRDAARALGVSEKAVRQLLVRARARARASMGWLVVPPVVFRRGPESPHPSRLPSLARRALAHCMPVGSGAPIDGAQALVWLTPVLAAVAVAAPRLGDRQPAAHRPTPPARQAKITRAPSGPGPLAVVPASSPRPSAHIARVSQALADPRPALPAAARDRPAAAQVQGVGSAPNARRRDGAGTGDAGPPGHLTATAVTDLARPTVAPVPRLPAVSAPSPPLQPTAPAAVVSGLSAHLDAAATAAPGTAPPLASDLEAVAEEAAPSL